MPTTNKIKRYNTSKVIRASKYEDTNSERILKAADNYATKQIPDPFEGRYGDLTGTGGDFSVLEPAYPPTELMKLPNINNTLGQCVEAMATNIEGTGFTLEFIGKEEEKESEEVQEEKLRIESLLEVPNPDESTIDIRKKARKDYETIGWLALEVGRDQETGEILWFSHVPANTVRKTKKDKDTTTVQVWLRRSGEWREETMERRFKRYVQRSGAKKVFFKEYGDPRRISQSNGTELAEGSRAVEANELIWVERYVPGEIYGLPRYVNNLPSILGSREAELVNLQFFNDNAIPALAILISGGYLTDETVDELQQRFAHRGRDTMNKVLIIEAQDSGEQLEGGSAKPSLTMVPLGGDRQGDALFQNYDKNNSVKIRSSFRLPPIVLGLSEDYTLATAQSSMEVAEAQVFGPERAEIDKVFNDKLLSVNGRPPVFWRFRSNPVKIAGTAALLDAMPTFDDVGAMTPNIAIRIFNSIFGMSVPFIEEEYGDRPYGLTQQAAQSFDAELEGGDFFATLKRKTPKDKSATKRKTKTKEKEKKVAISQKPKPVKKTEEGLSLKYPQPTVLEFTPRRRTPPEPITARPRSLKAA